MPYLAENPEDEDDLKLFNTTITNTTNVSTNPNLFNTSLSSSPETSSDNSFFYSFAGSVRAICLSFGLMIAALYLVYAAILYFGSLRTRMKDIIPSELFASHAVRGYTSMKRAANFKLTKLLLQGHALHSTEAWKYFLKEKQDTVDMGHGDDVVMKNFVLYGNQQEKAGGILWTWKRILTRTIFEEEGIWISTRLVIIQTGQIIVSAIFIGVLIARTPVLADNAQRARDKLPPNVPQWVYDIVPKSWMLKVSMYPAVACAGLVCVVLVTLYIPR